MLRSQCNSLAVISQFLVNAFIVCGAEAWTGAGRCCNSSGCHPTSVLLESRPCLIHITAVTETISVPSKGSVPLLGLVLLTVASQFSKALTKEIAEAMICSSVSQSHSQQWRLHQRYGALMLSCQSSSKEHASCRAQAFWAMHRSSSLDVLGRPQALGNGRSARPGFLHHIAGVHPLPPHARLRSKMAFTHRIISLPLPITTHYVGLQ